MELWDGREDHWYAGAEGDWAGVEFVAAAGRDWTKDQADEGSLYRPRREAEEVMASSEASEVDA